MSFDLDHLDYSAEAFDARAREFAFWTGVIGLVLSALVYLAIFCSGQLILHYKITSPIYAALLSTMTLAAYFDWRSGLVTNFSVASIFMVFWLSSYAEAHQNHLTFVSTPLILFVPVLLMMVLHHKLVIGLAFVQFGLVLHYSFKYGGHFYAPDWSRAEHLQSSLSLAALSTLCVFAVAIVSRKRQQTDRKLQALVASQASLATTDYLTELPNRRAFSARVNEQLAKALHDPRSLKVGIIDLDGFKGVNDVYGHAAGDALLLEAANRLRTVLPEDCFIARLGGDEFGVCLFENEHDINDVGSLLCAELSRPFQLDDTMVRVGGSAGFASARSTDSNISSLLERADYALYRSKAATKGRVTNFSEHDEYRIERARIIKRNLLSDKLFDELDVVFQPIVFPTTGVVKAMETLVRWRSSVLGDVPPSEFIPIAEQIGRISDITSFVLRRGLEVAAQWPEHIFVSLNMSAADLSDQSSICRLLKILDASPVSNSRVVLELTETSIIYDHTRGSECLEALRNAGVHIALDDFGTGYSSLSYLRRLKIKKLKIDRSFTTDIETDRVARNLLNGIIELCAGIGIDCVVEGIENADQLKTIAPHKNALAQGFYFSKPIPEREAQAYITRSSGTKLRLIAS